MAWPVWYVVIQACDFINKQKSADFPVFKNQNIISHFSCRYMQYMERKGEGEQLPPLPPSERREL